MFGSFHSQTSCIAYDLPCLILSCEQNLKDGDDKSPFVVCNFKLVQEQWMRVISAFSFSRFLCASVFPCFDSWRPYLSLNVANTNHGENKHEWVN